MTYENSDSIKKTKTTILYPDGQKNRSEATVISEHVLNVFINERQVYRLVCTGTDLKELVAGRMFTDGLIERSDDIDKMYFGKDESEVNVLLKEDLKRKKVLTKVGEYKWEPEWVFALLEEFRCRKGIHSLTGGSHMSILASCGRTLYMGEDIGRHNAVDKAVGHAILNNISLSGCMIFTTGRVPVDMVEKVISAHIPVLVSKSSPTKESVDMAKEYGLTLICRAWPDKFEIF